MKRLIIPYNPALKEFAKKLRQNMTFSEVKLWNELKNGKMMGYDFDRQRPIGNYIVDFYCKDLKLALELDGITHLDEKVILKDEIRQDELEMLGVNFLRFDALLIVNKVESVLKEIETWIIEYESKNGVVEFVKRKRNPPLPLPGGDANTQLPGGDANSQLPGGDANSQLPGGDANSQLPGGDANSPGFETNLGNQPTLQDNDVRILNVETL